MDWEVLGAARRCRSPGHPRRVLGAGVTWLAAGVQLGDVVTIRRRGEPLQAKSRGVPGRGAVAVALGSVGVGPDDPWKERASASSSASTSSGTCSMRVDVPRRSSAHGRGDRVPYGRPRALSACRSGVTMTACAIDELLTIGREQRLGNGGGRKAAPTNWRAPRSGRGRGGLVGERGRGRGILRRGLRRGGGGRGGVATSDAPPLERIARRT